MKKLSFSALMAFMTDWQQENNMQFTVLGGRHSVLERPLSEAKRPFILAN